MCGVGDIGSCVGIEILSLYVGCSLNWEGLIEGIWGFWGDWGVDFELLVLEFV